MADPADILRRLRHHGGYPELNGVVPTDTLFEICFRIRRGEHEHDLYSAVAEIVRLFQMIPRNDLKAKALQYAAPVAAMISECLATADFVARTENSHPSVLTQLRRAAWQIACGWEALAAGDIDDVVEHVALEAAMREMTLN